MRQFAGTWQQLPLPVQHVARMQRSVIQDCFRHEHFPDYVSLHPGYDTRRLDVITLQNYSLLHE